MPDFSEVARDAADTQHRAAERGAPEAASPDGLGVALLPALGASGAGAGGLRPSEYGRGLSPNRFLALQRSAGNRATGLALGRPVLQRAPVQDPEVETMNAGGVETASSSGSSAEVPGGPLETTEEAGARGVERAGGMDLDRWSGTPSGEEVAPGSPGARGGPGNGNEGTLPPGVGPAYGNEGTLPPGRGPAYGNEGAGAVGGGIAAAIEQAAAGAAQAGAGGAAGTAGETAAGAAQAGAGGAAGGAAAKTAAGAAQAGAGGAAGAAGETAAGVAQAGAGGAAGGAAAETAAGAAQAGAGGAAGAAGETAAGAAQAGAASAAGVAAGETAAGAAQAGAASGAAGAAGETAAGAAQAGAAAGAAGETAAGAAQAGAGGAAGSLGEESASAGAAGGAAGGALAEVAGAAGAAAGAALGEAAGATGAAATAGAEAAAGGAAGSAAAAGGNAAGAAAGGETAAGGAAGAAGSAGRAAGSAGGGAAAGGAAGAAAGGAAHAGAEGEHAGGGGADALGGGGGPGESEEIPAVSEPGDVAVPEIAGLHEAPPEVPQAEVEDQAPPAAEEPENLEAGAEGIEQQAQGGGGGIIDALIDRAMSTFRGIASTVGNGVRSAATAIGSRVRGFFTQAFDFATSLVTSVVSGVKGIAGAIASEIKTHLGALKDGVKGIVTRVFSAVRGAMGAVGGAIQGAITAILSGRPVMDTIMAPFRAIFGGMFSGITGQITAIIERIRGVVNGVIDRVIQTITSIGQTITNGLTFLGGLVTAAAAFLNSELTRLSSWIAEAVSGLPGVLRDVITAIVNRVIAFARRVVDGIVARARAFIQRAISRVTAFVQGLVGVITRVVARIRSLVQSVVDTVVAGVRTVANAINRVREWVVKKVSAFVARALKAVLDPIAERLKARVLSLIGPAAAGAIRQAQLMFPNGMPTPPEVVQAATQGASQVASQAGESILAGLTNPEGDHIGFGIQLNADAGYGGGLGVGASAMFDIVLDYRRNDIGFFLSPGAGGQVNVGEVGASAGVSGLGAWGTVGTFGDANADVLSAYGGWFTNVTYGAQAELAVEGGIGVSTGGSIYRGGATPGIPLFSYTPLGADQHPVPGTGTPATTTPGTTTAGTPDTPGTLPLGEVRFPRQVSDVESAPGGPAAVDHAAELVRDFPTSTPSGEVRSVDVLGEASRVWQRPRSGKTRAEENVDLAAARGRSVGSRLRGLLPGVSVTDHGNGDLRAASAGKPERDASPEDQRASMVASTLVRGTPGTTTPPTTTPGTPPTMAPDQHTVSALSMPNPFQARQTTGWDTTVSLSGVAGAEGKLGVYGGAGVSYSFPLGKTHLDADTMRAIRITVGFLKLTADVASISPLGFIRDALGLAAINNERAGVAQEMTSSITNWTIPLPPGTAAA